MAKKGKKTGVEARRPGDQGAIEDIHRTQGASLIIDNQLTLLVQGTAKSAPRNKALPLTARPSSPRLVVSSSGERHDWVINKEIYV
jgi:hypothetical protein